MELCRNASSSLELGKDAGALYVCPMIQTFDVQGGPDFGRRHIPVLREQLRMRNLDGLIVPHEDEYQNEYLPEAPDRARAASSRRPRRRA